MNTIAADNALTERVLEGFRADEHVRERLPGGGVLNIDRKLPFLLLYRQPADEDAGTERLVLGEASYLLATADGSGVRALVRALAETATEELGSFLLLEVWAGEPDSRRFAIHAPAGPAATSVDALRRGLDTLRAGDFITETVVRTTDERHPPALGPILTARECWEIGALLLGLEVPPLYRDEETGAVYPVFLRRLRHLLSPVLRQAAYEFTRVQTTTELKSRHVLGPRRFGRGLADADRELTEVERSYPFLLLMSPVNSAEAWSRFREDGYERPPEFRYRLLPVDPDLLKRRLYAIDLDPVADPAMSFLLHDKREELDRQITLLAKRSTPDFRYASILLYGAVDDALLEVARDILRDVPPPARRGPVELVHADDFAELARREIAHYRTHLPDLAADVQVRPDLIGLMVSQGNLLIGHELALRAARVEALLHHEVGTHVLTYYNGRAQPLRQLFTGLAGYDELQEGLAVLSEYLVGGLDAARMRTLAARVVAADSVEHGADFMETFRLLRDEHGVSPGGAFSITERVHQCGGFTRDLIYLRGLLRLVEHLQDGGELEPLYIGKIAARHVDIIAELRARGYLVPPPLLPRVFELPETGARVEAVRNGLPLLDMIGPGT